MLKSEALAELGEPFREVLDIMIEELRKIKILVRNGGTEMRFEEIKGDGRDEIPIDEIWYFIDQDKYGVEVGVQISKWCVQMMDAGQLCIKV